MLRSWPLSLAFIASVAIVTVPSALMLMPMPLRIETAFVSDSMLCTSISSAPTVIVDGNVAVKPVIFSFMSEILAVSEYIVSDTAPTYKPVASCSKSKYCVSIPDKLPSSNLPTEPSPALKVPNVSCDVVPVFIKAAFASRVCENCVTAALYRVITPSIICCMLSEAKPKLVSRSLIFSSPCSLIYAAASISSLNISLIRALVRSSAS